MSHKPASWIFSGAIAQVTGRPDAESLVAIVDAQGHHLGMGLYSPSSQLRVRRVAALPPDARELGQAELSQAINACLARRARLGYASPEAFRLVNSEGDGLPGLIVDHLGDLVVMQLTAAGMAARRASIVAALREVVGAEVALREVAAPQIFRDREQIEAVDGFHGPHQPTRVALREFGVRFEVQTDAMQKTGHYLDIREHRRWLGQRARDLEVFDGYCYSGGFGLHAAHQGAARVVSVDSSPKACALARANAALNGLEQVEVRQAKIARALREAQAREERFDVVVLDPPKLAPNKRQLDKAMRHLDGVTAEALRVLRPGGLLVISSCSAAMGIDELTQIAMRASRTCGRWCTVVHAGFQAGDHPYVPAMREGRYLSVLAAVVDD